MYHTKPCLSFKDPAFVKSIIQYISILLIVISTHFDKLMTLPPKFQKTTLFTRRSSQGICGLHSSNQKPVCNSYGDVV